LNGSHNNSLVYLVHLSFDYRHSLDRQFSKTIYEYKHTNNTIDMFKCEHMNSTAISRQVAANMERQPASWIGKSAINIWIMSSQLCHLNSNLNLLQGWLERNQSSRRILTMCCSVLLVQACCTCPGTGTRQTDPGSATAMYKWIY